MKQKSKDLIKEYLRAIGARGGNAGSKADKVKAAKARWAKVGK